MRTRTPFASRTTSGTFGKTWSRPTRSNAMGRANHSGTCEPTNGSSGSTLVRNYRDSKRTTSWAYLPPADSILSQSLSAMTRICGRFLESFTSRAGKKPSISPERMAFATTCTRRSSETEWTTTSDAPEWVRYVQEKLWMVQTPRQISGPASWHVITRQARRKTMPSTKQD